MDHVISADKSEDLMIDAKPLNWAWNLNQFFNHEDEAAILKAIQDLRETHNGVFDTGELFKRMEEILEISRSCIFTPPAAMIIIANIF
jgi:hypothetical protein